MRRLILTACLLPAALLGGCVKFGSKPPATLLTIESEAKVAPGTVSEGGNGTVTIIEPDVPKALNTLRVAVRTDGNNFAYVPDAVWVDTPRNLFRALLAETVAAKSSMLVLDPGQFSADPGRRLMGELIEFGIDADAKQAVVTFDAALMGKAGRITKRRFSARVPVRDIDKERVAPAIAKAANMVADEVVEWLKAGE
jgi:cholesterol transport system auxiliary component